MSGPFKRSLPRSMFARRAIASLAVLALLAGCGSGGGPSVSGSASETAKSESGLSSLWAKVRGLTIESGKTVEMPALGLIADAFLRDGQARGVDSRDMTEHGIFRAGRPIPAFESQVVDAAKQLRDEIASTRPEDRADWLKQTPLDADHQVYAVPILIALQPRKGWEVNAIDDCRVDPRFDTPFFRKNRPPCRYDGEAHIRYMELLAISAIYTNDVFARLGEELGGTRLADPDAASARVLAAYQAIPAADLAAALKRASGQVVGGHFSTDLTGSGNVHFTHSAAGDFVGDARGLTWTKAGGVWFGDSRIAGQSVNFRLASTSSLSQTRSQQGQDGVSAGAEVQGAGGVGAVK